jgi:hypothetical protein
MRVYRLTTEIDINAPRSRIWQILTNTEAFVRWNPLIPSMRGSLQPGATIRITLTPPRLKPFAIRPKVIHVDKEHALVWLGRLGLPGLFDGEHHFELEEVGDGQTRFMHWEQFSGLLAPFLKKMINHSVKEGFEQMNAALKRRAESGETLL